MKKQSFDLPEYGKASSFGEFLNRFVGGGLAIANKGFADQKEREEKEEKELQKQLKEARKEHERVINEKRRQIRDLEKQKKLERPFYEKLGFKSATTKAITREQQRLSNEINQLTGLGEIELSEDSGLLKAIKGVNLKDTLKSLPSGVMEAGEGLMGLGENFLPGHAGNLSGILKRGIRKTKEDYENLVGIEDRAGLGAKGGRVIGEILTPTPGGKLKWGGKLLKALGIGGLWGAIEAGKQDYDTPEEARDATIKNALIGTGIGLGTHAVGSKLSKYLSRNNKVKKDFAKIRNDAVLKEEEEILRAAKNMGEDATIGEIVGSGKTLKKITRDSSFLNKNRLEKVEDHMKDSAREFAEGLPKGEKLNLYRGIDRTKAHVKEEASKLYDAVKEEGIGREGIMPKRQVQEWLSAIKQASQNTKGIPDLKGKGVASDKYIQELENLLMRSPDDHKAFQRFVIKNEGKIPKADDFLTFRRKVKGLLEKASSENKQALDVLDESIEKIVKDLDTGDSLSKADKLFATKTAPFNDKGLLEAIEAGKFKEAAPGAPSVTSVFGKQSTNNAKIFDNLTTKDKERVIGAFVEEAMEKKGKSEPARAIYEAWHEIPEYIKKTEDEKIKNILKGLKTIADKNQQLSGIQQATSNTIGSRPDVRRLTSYLTLNPLRLIGLAESIAKKSHHAAYRSRTSAKNLKYYLKPELLDEITNRGGERISRPLMQLLMHKDNKNKQNETNNYELISNM